MRTTKFIYVHPTLEVVASYEYTPQGWFYTDAKGNRTMTTETHVLAVAHDTREARIVSNVHYDDACCTVTLAE